MTLNKNPNNWFTDKAAPLAILDKDETLALIASGWPEGTDKYRVKSQYICDFLDTLEKEGYVYNAPAVHRFEKEHGLTPQGENGTVLSVLIYNAQSYRRGDALVAAGWLPGALLMVDGAKIVAQGSGMLGNTVQEVLTVREVAGKLYAFRPRKRKYAVNVSAMPCKLEQAA